MAEESERASLWTSATVVAAIISGVTAVMAAVLPWALSVLGKEESGTPQAVPSQRVSFSEASSPITPIAPASSTATAPNLTFGVWTIVNSIDEAGTDFSGSTLKFTSQRTITGGLEATGFFEWRSGEFVFGREHVVANFDESSRQLFIEGKYTESPTGTLATGSFSARLSEDGRRLANGTWGNTPGNLPGIPGGWEARR